MLAIEFPSCGLSAQVLRLAERDVIQPKAGEVRVRMLCSPVNPSDLLFVRGQYTTNPIFPQVPGFEGVGVVEAIGGGLRGRFFQGKRVVVLNQQGGTWAEQVIVPASKIVPVSKSFSDHQAATSFVNPMTAWMMVQRVLQVRSGDWLVQTAAGSILGQMVIRLGQHLGFHTINIVRSNHAAKRCRDSGAEHVIQWDETVDSETELRRKIADTIDTKRLSFAIDAVSGKTGSAVLSCLSRRGRFLSYGSLSGESLSVPTRQMMTNQWSIDSFWLGHRMQTLNLLTKLKVIRRVQKLVQVGVLATPVAEVFPLAEFESALALAESSPCDGRVLFSMG